MRYLGTSDSTQNFKECLQLFRTRANSLQMLDPEIFFVPASLKTPLTLSFSSLPLLDESGSGQPDGMDMVVCRAPGGEFYVEGETWNLDECTRCTCRKGRVLCDTEMCPPALCQAPIRNKDTCCHVCPGNLGLGGGKDSRRPRRGRKFCY